MASSPQTLQERAQAEVARRRLQDEAQALLDSRMLTADAQALVAQEEGSEEERLRQARLDVSNNVEGIAAIMAGGVSPGPESKAADATAAGGGKPLSDFASFFKRGIQSATDVVSQAIKLPPRPEGQEFIAPIGTMGGTSGDIGALAAQLIGSILQSPPDIVRVTQDPKRVVEEEGVVGLIAGFTEMVLGPTALGVSGDVADLVRVIRRGVGKIPSGVVPTAAEKAVLKALPPGPVDTISGPVVPSQFRVPISRAQREEAAEMLRQRDINMPIRQGPEVTPNVITRSRAETIDPATGRIVGAPGPIRQGRISLDSRVTKAIEKLDAIDEADQALVDASYQTAFEDPTGVPAFHIVTKNPEAIQLQGIIGELPPPIAAATKSADLVAERAVRIASDFDPEYMRRVYKAITGKTTAPRDADDLRRVAEYLDEVRSGRQTMPASIQDMKDVRKKFGKDSFTDAKPTKKMRLKDVDSGPAMKDHIKPASRGNMDRGIGLMSRLVADFDHNLPELAAKMRPHFEDKRKFLADLDDKYRGIMGGIKEGDRFDKEIAQILTGQHGDVFALEARTATSPTLSRKSIEIAAEARRDLDDMYMTMKGEGVPDLNYRKAYLTLIRDAYSEAVPQTMVRNLGASKAWRYMVRSTDDLAESFVESFQVYAHAAADQIFIQKRALDELNEARKSAVEVMDATNREIQATIQEAQQLAKDGRKVSAARKMFSAGRKRVAAAREANVTDLMDAQKSLLKGEQSSAANVLDRMFITAASLAGKNIAARPAARLSMQFSTGLFRGILGGNISASVNNMTQVIQALTTAKPRHSLNGMVRFFQPFGKGAQGQGGFARFDLFPGVKGARDAKLTHDLAELMIESRALSHSTYGKRRKWIVKASGGTMRTFDDVLFAPFNFAEFSNRGMAYHIGTSEALDLGATLEEAAKRGHEFAKETQFVYDELARSPYLKGVITRPLFGVLTSFPVKQAQFLKGLAKNNKAGLVRYIATMGYLNYILDKHNISLPALTDNVSLDSLPFGVASKLGLDRDIGIPFTDKSFNPAKTGIPGTAFLRQLEGADVFKLSPGGQLVTLMQDISNAATSGDPVNFGKKLTEFLDAASNAIIPAGVAIKKGVRSFTDVRRGKREKLGSSVTDSFRKDAPFFESLRGLPVVRQSPFGARDGIATDTSLGEEVARNLGVQIAQKEIDRDGLFEQRQFIFGMRSERRQSQVIMKRLEEAGDDEGVKRMGKAVHATVRGFNRFTKNSETVEYLRFIDGLSKDEQTLLRKEYPETEEMYQRAIVIQRRLVRRNRR